jgi:hypothetical protein
VIEKINVFLKDLRGLVRLAKPVTLEVAAFVLLLIAVWRLLSGELFR